MVAHASLRPARSSIRFFVRFFLSFFFYVFLATSPAPVFAAYVEISNVVPRLDTSGEILDMHDGVVQHLNETYFWFAASYGDCIEPKSNSGCSEGSKPGTCGFLLNHNVSLASSSNLRDWTNHGPVFQIAESHLRTQNAIMFCPKVLGFCIYGAYRGKSST